MAHHPDVFISSTSEDLKEYREQAGKAAVANDFLPHMMENWAAAGHAPTLKACLERAAVAAALVDWRKRHPAFEAAVAPGDPETYLEKLQEANSLIRITGLKTKRTEPYVFPIDQMYIPLKTLAKQERVPSDAIGEME